jgi:cytochrome P450
MIVEAWNHKQSYDDADIVLRRNPTVSAASIFASPTDPIAAVTHADPYGYYSHLASERPFYRDAKIGMWVASSAGAVTSVLTNPACRVRPVAEPVPKSVAGSPAAAIFGRLIRMNDGELHPPLKRAIVAALDAVDATLLSQLSDRWAAHLAPMLAPEVESTTLMEFGFGLSTHVLGSLLGIPDDALLLLTRRVREYTLGLSPACSPEQLARAKTAASQLLEQFHLRYRSLLQSGGESLFGELIRQARRFCCDDPDAVVANGVGFLTQAYEAVAALVNTTLLALARQPVIREQVATRRALLADVIDEVLRFDSPVQNTRRYVLEVTIIEGQELRPSDAVLAVLAAANRDPRANPDPDRFDVLRRERQLFTFGVGPHACPGRQVATTIAAAGVQRLLENGVDPGRLETSPPYLPSPNVRFPVLGLRAGADR